MYLELFVAYIHTCTHSYIHTYTYSTQGRMKSFDNILTNSMINYRSNFSSIHICYSYNLTAPPPPPPPRMHTDQRTLVLVLCRNVPPSLLSVTAVDEGRCGKHHCLPVPGVFEVNRHTISPEHTHIWSEFLFLHLHHHKAVVPLKALRWSPSISMDIHVDIVSHTLCCFMCELCTAKWEMSENKQTDTNKQSQHVNAL